MAPKSAAAGDSAARASSAPTGHKRKSLKGRKSLNSSLASLSDAAPEEDAAKQAEEERKKGGEDYWDVRMFRSRCWGQSLKVNGGSNARVVKKLTGTLRDSRAASETALRRTAVESLIPAACVGNRGALAAQAKALGDSEEIVRRAALSALQKAAGGKRAESGGAVAVALTEAFPKFSFDADTQIRRSAAASLARLTPQQDKDLAKIAFSWIEDDDAVVRASATEALGFAGSGSAALDTLKESLADTDWRVSRAACRALTKLPTINPKKGGDERSEASAGGSSRCSSRSRSGTAGSRPRTNAKLSAALAHASTAADVLGECCRSNLLRGIPRADAVKALGKAAQPGEKGAMLVAAHHLTDVDLQVREAAIGALKQLAPGDRAGAIRAAVSQLTCMDFRARESASQALGAISSSNNEIAFNLAASALEGEDWRGRRGAASALKRLGELGDGAAREAVFAVLIPRLEHPEWSIRRKAAQALGVVARGVGDVRAIKLLAGLARDPDENVRVAVAEALPGAAPPTKCKEAVMMAATFAGDSNPLIRVAALNALEQLACPERSRSRAAVHAVGGCLQDDVEEVRLTAERVMKVIAPARRTAIDDVAKRLADPDEGVRRAAVEAFKGVAKGNRERALKRAIPLLRHEDAGVRQAVSEAMQGMMKPQEAAVVAAAAHTVGRFRRRFPQAAGYADWDWAQYDELEAEAELDNAFTEEGAMGETEPAPYESEAPYDSEAVVAEVEHVVPIKEDTDTESELSESDTDEDIEPHEEVESSHLDASPTSALSMTL